MSDAPAYEREPYRTQMEADVVRAGVEGARPYAVLDDSILYPEAGGQPADRGLLNEVLVLDVQKREGEVRHYLAAPVAPGPVTLRLDWARRFDHMQQHTGQHLLTAVAEDRFGWETTAFHLGEEASDVELASPRPTADDLARLEEAVAAEIRAARPVTLRRVTPEELATLKVRTRGLPEGFEGNVRLVEIQGLDLNTCGGTHLRSTAEIELLKLLETEAIRGGTRLFFAAGGRVRRRMEGHERRNAALRALLGAPDAELAAVLGTKLEQLRSAERRVRALYEELAGALAAALADGPGRVAERHVEGRDLAFLQRAARQAVAAAPGKAVLLTGSADGQHSFALAAGEELELDVAALGREVAALLGGRGGGSGRLFQGKAGSLEARDRALARLREAAEEGPARPPRA